MADRDRDVELGLRAANLAISDVRAELHHLAAQVVALIDVIGAHLGAPIAHAVADAAGPILDQIEVAIERADGLGRLHIGTEPDKYALATVDGPPCAELIPLCGARCCRLRFALTTQDLDEGVIRWDRGRPYLIEHAGGRCVHNAAAGGCTAYAHRPATCRTYDCRGDRRVWLDYAARIPAPDDALDGEPPGLDLAGLLDKVRARRLALAVEAAALRDSGT
jgi:hypothetical protein